MGWRKQPLLADGWEVMINLVFLRKKIIGAGKDLLLARVTGWQKNTKLDLFLI